MPEDTLKRKLAGAAVALGVNLQLDSSWLVEMSGLAGFDYVMLDGEHGLVWGELPRLVLAADAAGIAAVDGIDALFVGPADLAQSMGMPGRDRDPLVRSAMAAAARRVGSSAGDRVVTGASAFSGEDVRLYRGMGYRLFLTGSTHVIRRSLEALQRDLALGREAGREA